MNPTGPIVSNTGPLIALAKVDLLPLLRDLFGEVQIPPAVHHELLAKTTPEATRLAKAFGEYVQISPEPPIVRGMEKALGSLGPGESQAVALASHSAAGLLVDDRQARTVARQLGIVVKGTVGVLLLAKQAQLVPRVAPVLEEMRSKGYWLSDSLVEAALRLAGE